MRSQKHASSPKKVKSASIGVILCSILSLLITLDPAHAIFKRLFGGGGAEAPPAATAPASTAAGVPDPRVEACETIAAPPTNPETTLGRWSALARSAVAGLPGTVAESARGASDAFTRISAEAAARQASLGEALEKISADAADLINQLGEIGATGANCSLAYTARLPVAAGKALITVVRFSGDTEGIRKHIVIPYVQILRRIRVHRETDAAEVARALADLSVHSALTGVLLQSVLANQVTIATFDVGHVMMMVPINGPSQAEENLGKFVVQALLGQARLALFTRGLSFSERIAVLTDSQTIVMDALEQMALRLGWQDLLDEVQAWRRADPSVAESSD